MASGVHPLSFRRTGGPPTITTLEGRETLPIQPKPTLTRVIHFRLWRWTVTAIMRHWKPGDSGPNGRCKLCPQCKAYDDGCLMVLGFEVPRASAPLFSSVDVPRQSSLVFGYHAATKIHAKIRRLSGSLNRTLRFQVADRLDEQGKLVEQNGRRSPQVRDFPQSSRAPGDPFTE